VATELDKWFDQNDELREALEQQIRRAWRVSVLQALRNASGNATPLHSAAE